MCVGDVWCFACGSIDGWCIDLSCVSFGGGFTHVAYADWSRNSYAAVSAGGDSSAKTTVNRPDSRVRRRALGGDHAVRIPQSAATLTKMDLVEPPGESRDPRFGRPVIRQPSPCEQHHEHAADCHRC